VSNPRRHADLVDATAAALFLSTTGRRPVTPGQVRTWAWRGQISRYGKDRHGRTLYRLSELNARARRSDTPPRKHGD
jgi:hypothetical protein